MKRDAATFVQILERIESADNKHILYEAEAAWPNGDVEWARDGWSDHEAFHIDLMIEKGLLREHVVSGEVHQNAGDRETYLVATNAAYDFLAEHRNSTFFRRGLRVLGGMLEKALSSVILPIIVSVMTVLILEYLL